MRNGHTPRRNRTNDTISKQPSARDEQSRTVRLRLDIRRPLSEPVAPPPKTTSTGDFPQSPINHMPVITTLSGDVIILNPAALSEATGPDTNRRTTWGFLGQWHPGLAGIPV